jgi:hypothetical protein
MILGMKYPNLDPQARIKTYYFSCCRHLFENDQTNAMIKDQLYQELEDNYSEHKQIYSSGFPSNSKSSEYSIRNDQWTTSSTTEGSLFQNKLRKRRMTESMDCQDNETNVKNTRRKLSVLSPNLAKFSRLSDASDSSSEFSTPLSASCNTDYERADMNQMRSIISTDRPKYASNNVP